MADKTSGNHERLLMNVSNKIFMKQTLDKSASLSLASFARIYHIKGESDRGGCEPMSVIKQRKLLSGFHQKG